MAFLKSGTQYHYYRHTQQKETCPLPKYITADNIEDAIFAAIMEITTNDALLNDIYKNSFSYFDEQLHTQQRRIASIRSQLAAVEGRAANLITSLSTFNQQQIEAFVKPQLDDLVSQKTGLAKELEENEKKFAELKKISPTPESIR